MKTLFLSFFIFFLAGCSSVKSVPPVSGELQPLNSVNVMSEQGNE